MANYNSPLELYYKAAYYMGYIPFFVKKNSAGKEQIICIVIYIMRANHCLRVTHKRYKPMAVARDQIPGNPVDHFECFCRLALVLIYSTTLHTNVCKSHRHTRFLDTLSRYSARHPSHKYGKWVLSTPVVLAALIAFFITYTLVLQVYFIIQLERDEMWGRRGDSIFWFQTNFRKISSTDFPVIVVLYKVFHFIYYFVIILHEMLERFTLLITFLVFFVIGLNYSNNMRSNDFRLKTAYNQYKAIRHLVRVYCKVYGSLLQTIAAYDILFASTFLIMSWGWKPVGTDYGTVTYLSTHLFAVVTMYSLGGIFSQQMLNIRAAIGGNNGRNVIIKFWITRTKCGLGGILIPINFRSLNWALNNLLTIFLVCVTNCDYLNV